MRIDTMIYGTLVKYAKEDGSPLMPKSTLSVTAVMGDNKSSTPSFRGLKKGTKLNLVFKINAKGVKEGTDGRYEFLWVAEDGYAMIKPVGGGFFSRGSCSPNKIESMEIEQ